jgi:copper(I)-binding protein
MKEKALRQLVPIAAILCLALSACDNVKSEEATVESAWIRLPVIPGRPGAAYFTLRSGVDPLTLKSVSSPQAERAEIHDSRMQNGVMHMEPLRAVEIPSHGAVEFKPGGRHVMLFGIDPTLKAGDRISLRFMLQPPVEILTEAEVRSPGAGMHEGD